MNLTKGTEEVPFVILNKTFMGGNSRAIDVRTETFMGMAEKVDTRIFKKNQLSSDLIQLFNKINELFEFKYSNHLWPVPDEIISCVTGSSKFIFSDAISNSSFSSVKPFIGDIDIIIPDYNYELFEKFSVELYEHDLFPFTYLGQDRTSFGTTFLSVFRYEQGGKTVNIQIDFEKNEFVNKRPTEWAKFSHSSSWVDILNDLKGVHHKLLLTNIVRVLTELDDAVLATKSSTPDKIRLVEGQRASERPSEYAFSVDKGLRRKIEEIGATLNNCEVYKEISTAESVFIKQVDQIFFTIFKKYPTKSQLINFYSTSGLFSIMAELLNEYQIKEIFYRLLVINLYGDRAQLIEKDITLDESVKDSIIIKMQRRFPFLNKFDHKILQYKAKYYDRHKS